MEHVRIAMVTGAGSGIGRAVALALGAHGYSVVLAGRRSDAIATLRGLLAVPSAVTPPLLRLDATSRSLRNDPEFQQLVATGR